MPTPDLKNLFPRTGYVDSADGSGHHIYYEEYGPPDAPPVIMVHGNAGYIFDPQKLSLWDCDRQHVVIMHMRGVGQSAPAAKTDHNLYPDLADDIETLRRHLNLPPVTVCGWSGGAAVSLLYAEKYPQNCQALILYGAFLGGAAELHDYYDRCRAEHPDGWQQFAAYYGAQDMPEILSRHQDAILRGTPEQQLAATIRYEMIFESPAPDFETFKAGKSPLMWQELVRNRIVFTNMCEQNFGLSPDQIERNAAPLHNIPALFVRGEKDFIASRESIDRLAQNWPAARKAVIPDAGHDIHDAALQPPLAALIRTFLQPEQPSPQAAPTLSAP